MQHNALTEGWYLVMELEKKARKIGFFIFFLTIHVQNLNSFYILAS